MAQNSSRLGHEELLVRYKQTCGEKAIERYKNLSAGKSVDILTPDPELAAIEQELMRRMKLGDPGVHDLTVKP